MKTKEILITLSSDVYEGALRATIDLEKHLALFAHLLADRAKAAHPGVDILTIPTLAEQERQRERDAELAATQDAARQAQIHDLIEEVPEHHRAALEPQLAQLAQQRITLDEARAKMGELLQKEEQLHAQEAARQKAGLMAALESPEILAAVKKHLKIEAQQN